MMRQILRKILKLVIGVLLIGFVLAAIAAITLHQWLTQSPEAGARIVAQVESVSHFRFKYKSVDARLGWFGPEIVFTDALVIAPGADIPIVHARSGRVGFDAWRSLRTFKLASGRVILEGAEVYVDVTEDGVSIRGQGDLGKGSHLSIADLPVGHLRLLDAAVTVEDHRQNVDPWQINQVSLELERDPSRLRFGVSVHLPGKLSADLALDGDIRGDLSQWLEADWRFDGRMRHASLGSWASLVPQWVHLPRSGSGQWSFDVQGHGSAVQSLDTQLDLQKVVSESGLTIHAISGRLALQRHESEIAIQGRDLTIDADHDHWRHGQFDLGFSLDNNGGLRFVKLKSPQLSLGAFTVLAELIPEHPLRSWVVGLRPQGLINQIDLNAQITDRWRLNGEGSGQLQGISWQAYGKIPGVSNLNATISLRDNSGQLLIAGHDLKIDLANQLPEPIELRDINFPVTYHAQADGLNLSVKQFNIQNADGSGEGIFQLWLPYAETSAPIVLLDSHVKNVDARHVPNYLPLRKFPAVATNWLQEAFLQGHATQGHIVLSGDVSKFPFRDGGGVFRASADISGLRMHYANDFQDLEDARGSAVFENQGFSANLVAGRIGGLMVSNLSGGIEDFKEGELRLVGEAHGDMKAALTYVQNSLVGPKLGYEFMHLAGQGPIGAKVDLYFPFKQFANRIVSVDVGLKNVKLHAPYWDDDIKDVSGNLSIRNWEVRTNDLSAFTLGGPLHIKASTEVNKKGQSGEHQLIVEASGRGQGDRAAALLGFTDPKIMSGGFEWTAKMISPRIEFRAKPVYDEANDVWRDQEWQVHFLPISIHLESGLQGLALNLPKPLKKVTNDKRSLKVDVLVDLKDLNGKTNLKDSVKDTLKTPTALAHINLGNDSALLQWVFPDGPHFDRGRVRLGGSVNESLMQPGLSIEGHAPSLDLSAWLGLPLRGGQGTSLSEVLRTGNLDVDRLEFLGFGFPGMHLKLSSDNKSWITEVEGTAAAGKITVPFTLPSSGVVNIDLDRIAADGYIDDHSDDSTNDESANVSLRDATTLPAIQVHVNEMMFQKRKFGTFSARIERSTEGLVLKEATLKGSTFEGSASGSWSNKNDQSLVHLSYTIDSHNVEETLSDWGFEPVLSGKSGRLSGEFNWDQGLQGGILSRLTGHSKVAIEQGQLVNVHPGAFKVLGLLSLSALPKRLLLDFRDLTDSGLAFESVKGDFDFANGNAVTNNLLLKGPAVEIAIVGRTGVVARDYDQTIRVVGKVQTPLAAAGGVIAGPAVGAAVLLFTNVFHGSVAGLNATYYHISGSWDNPKIDHLGSTRPKASDGSQSPSAEPAH